MKMKVGDLVRPVEPATYKGKEFVSALVVNKRPGSDPFGTTEVEVLHRDGSTEWFPMWMMKMENINDA